MKVDDLVICIKTHVSYAGITGAIKGKIYRILGIYKCSCGHHCLDVGIPFPEGFARIKTRCSKCYQRHYWYDTWYMPVTIFRTIDWEDCRDELIDELNEHLEKPEIEKIPQL